MSELQHILDQPPTNCGTQIQEMFEKIGPLNLEQLVCDGKLKIEDECFENKVIKHNITNEKGDRRSGQYVDGKFNGVGRAEKSGTCLLEGQLIEETFHTGYVRIILSQGIIFDKFKSGNPSKGWNYMTPDQYLNMFFPRDD